ncbi:hypothetical protein J3459_011934 [Metarhizium acridum]|uniref:uncharacterized protein n=1 Tax=Metarhizium acridum TaxID=92637 RepID=UPI001C6AFBBD|nr:hypothetical protein J3458_022197 [Metarhizium acridum]KAG8418878.1 hypothetical protein J3459_011934 [Metarhizium acridum]
MRQFWSPEAQVKAARGVRALDDLLHVMSLGVTRVGATATFAIMTEAETWGNTDKLTTVMFKPTDEGIAGTY